MLHKKDINRPTIKNAFQATCEHRGTQELLNNVSSILDMVEKDDQLRTRWTTYQKKYPYAADVPYDAVLNSARSLLAILLTE